MKYETFQSRGSFDRKMERKKHRAAFFAFSEEKGGHDSLTHEK